MQRERRLVVVHRERDVGGKGASKQGRDKKRRESQSYLQSRHGSQSRQSITATRRSVMPVFGARRAGRQAMSVIPHPHMLC